VATYYTIDRANERVADLRAMLTLLRSQRDELRSLKVEYDAADPGDDERRLRLRMRGIVDQMQAMVDRIDAWGITLRDIDTGLVDFPALVNGRQVWLCWRLDDGPVEWWHELDTGIAGRLRLADLT
jgi:hypothetical protein